MYVSTQSFTRCNFRKSISQSDKLQSKNLNIYESVGGGRNQEKGVIYMIKADENADWFKRVD